MASAETFKKITIFGADWCSDCRRTEKLLKQLEIDFAKVDLEEVEDGADRAKAISGRTQIPVVVFPDGSHMVEPSDVDMRDKLRELSVIS